MGRLVAIASVPPLPGATNRASTSADCAILQASACSRPPDPMTITRIFALHAYARVMQETGGKGKGAAERQGGESPLIRLFGPPSPDGKKNRTACASYPSPRRGE